MFKDFSQFNSSRLIYQQPKKRAPEKKEQAAAKPKPSPKAKPDQKTRGREAIARKLRGVYIGDKVKQYIDDIFGRADQENSAEHTQLAAFVEDVERSYDYSWVEEAMKDPKWNLSPETHNICLMELRNVPFHQIMEWYEASDRGLPKQGEADKFPDQQIDISRIYRYLRRERSTSDPKRDVRYAVWQVVDRFLQKAGGKEAMKRKWVTMIDNPNVKPKNEAERKRLEWIRSSKPQKRYITWQAVLMAETDPSKVHVPGSSEISVKEITSREVK